MGDPSPKNCLLELTGSRLFVNSIVQKAAMKGANNSGGAGRSRRDSRSQLVSGTMVDFGFQFALFKAEVFGWEESDELNSPCL